MRATVASAVFGRTIDVGYWVAWTMGDGNTMAGVVLALRPGFHGEQVQRVDGTHCYVDRSKLRPATTEDVEAACAFYRDLGK